MTFSNNDMFAKTAFNFSNYANQELCEYLQKLDASEQANQKQEEEAITQKLPKVRKENAHFFGGLMGITSGLTGLAVASSARVLIMVLAGPVLGVGIGVATSVGILLLKKSVFKESAIKELDINLHRSVRLQRKIDLLAQRILTVNSDSNESDQLKTAKAFFENKLQKYTFELMNHHTHEQRIKPS